MKKIFMAVTLVLGVTSLATAQVTTSSNSYSSSSYVGSSSSSPLKDVLFRSNGVERMRLTSDGILGINTTIPSTYAGIHMHRKLILLTGDTPYGGSQIVFGRDEEELGTWGIEYNWFTSGKEGLNFWKPSGAPGGSGNYFLFLHNSGRVGVNTNNPTAQFTVNGNCLIGDENTALPAGYRLYVQNGILTEKVRVAVRNTTNWADYVFSNNYNLMPLSDLESYITKEKHLPNIPSAEEVVENGVDIGEFSSKLLEKVEELTLYIIEQNKKIEALEKELEGLK